MREKVRIWTKMESLRLQFFQSLRNLSSQPKRRPIRRHPIYFIILFRFKAVAEGTQWSSAPLNLVAKCGLNYDPISGWQMCLHTKSAAAAELAGTPVSPPGWGFFVQHLQRHCVSAVWPYPLDSHPDTTSSSNSFGSLFGWRYRPSISRRPQFYSL